jgi:hypothetical protein
MRTEQSGDLYCDIGVQTPVEKKTIPSPNTASQK